MDVCIPAGLGLGLSLRLLLLLGLVTGLEHVQGTLWTERGGKGKHWHSSHEHCSQQAFPYQEEPAHHT
jgi:hypothetical protein